MNNSVTYAIRAGGLAAYAAARAVADDANAVRTDALGATVWASSADAYAAWAAANPDAAARDAAHWVKKYEEMTGE